MADEKHFALLRRSVGDWNDNRRAKVKPPEWDQEERRMGGRLFPIELEEVHIQDADFARERLDSVDFSKAYLIGSTFEEASLHTADFSASLLGDTSFLGADLTDATFLRTTVWNCDFRRAKLTGAKLLATTVSGGDFAEADFTGLVLGASILADLDLRGVKGLDRVQHAGPTTIGLDTLAKSQGDIPEVFLRGCGVPDSVIAYAHSLVANPIQFYSCFISYSVKDESFAKRLYADLQAVGVRCWFAPHDLRVGDLHPQKIEDAIRIYDKLLLVLSKHSINSAWVCREVEAAWEKERRSKDKQVLFPVRLDDAVMKTEEPWAAHIRRTRHIGDFRRWKNEDNYRPAFDNLRAALTAEVEAAV